MNTGHATMTPTNSQNSMASNIPLPPGDPPPLHNQQQQQHPHHQQHHQQQQYPTPIFGSGLRPTATFESLAKKSDNIVESTLYQYGPGLAMPAVNPMTRLAQSNVSMPNFLQQRQMQQHQQQQQLQQQQQMHQHQQQMLQRQQMLHQNLSFRQPNLQAQQNLMMAQNQNSLRNNNLPMGVARPPVYLTNPMPPHCQTTPTSSVPTYHINPTPASSSTANFNLNNTVITTLSTPASTATSSLPDMSMSPPLDAIKGSGHPNNITLTTPPHPEPEQPQNRAETTTTKDLLTQVKETWERWTLNQMIQEHKSLGQQLDKSQMERARLEREINDIVRKNPGQNIELNPQFIRKKGDLTEMGRKCDDINQAIKFVAEKSDKKFGRKLENANMRQPLQHAAQQPKRFQRAKMSTAAPSPNTSKVDPKDKKNILLDLRDDDLWCNACDVHFKNLREYCIHLHKRDHNLNAETTSQPPWRHNDQHKRQLGRFETFSRYKSICSEVNDTVDTEFKMVHLDTVLNPSIKDRDELKKISLKREKKQFADDDKLFRFKGYDEIIPITGYYCKLCDRTMCDDKEVENHLKGWIHNYEHARSVALQSSHERDFRVKMEKSLKLLRESDKSQSTSNRHKEIQPKPPTVREKSPGPSNGLSSTGGARLPYKKPTSKIVDEHEAIADKFDQRKERDVPPMASSRPIPDQPTKVSKSDSKRSLPEIVPVTENQPSGALKRLRRPEQPAKSNKGRERDKESEQERESEADKESDIEKEPESDDKHKGVGRTLPVIIESSTEDEEYDPTPNIRSSRIEQDNDVQILSEVHLEQGDPDSPFPHLEITVTGNYPVRALTDERLSQNAVVKMNKINLDDYKEMLLDSSSLWARVDKLMTKKEPGEFEKNLDTVTVTAPCYIGQDGETVAAPMDRDTSDEGESDFRMDSLTGFFCS